MHYLDRHRLNTIDPAAFQTQRPYPWINPQGLLTPEGYHTLLEHLPSQEQFTPSFGQLCAHGQRSHDRFLLAYHDSLPVVQVWKEFIAELGGPIYRDFLSYLLGTRTFSWRFHWHYTPRGCFISPHCHAKDKLGSHIFYFNTEQDWDPVWGEQTLLLDDGGRFPRNSAPHIEDFDSTSASHATGNSSLLFAPNGRFWHAMRPLQCPEDRMRKVFIVVLGRFGAGERIKRILGWKAKGCGAAPLHRRNLPEIVPAHFSTQKRSSP